MEKKYVVIIINPADIVEQSDLFDDEESAKKMADELFDDLDRMNPNYSVNVIEVQISCEQGNLCYYPDKIHDGEEYDQPQWEIRFNMNKEDWKVFVSDDNIGDFGSDFSISAKSSNKKELSAWWGTRVKEVGTEYSNFDHMNLDDQVIAAISAAITEIRPPWNHEIEKEECYILAED